MTWTIPTKLAAICLSIICGIALLIVSRNKEPVFSLTVEIAPVENTYSLAKYSRIKETLNEPPTNAFLVRFRVSNPGSTPCAIAVMTCSYYECWGTDSKIISPWGWGCDGNFPYGILLNSTNVYSGELPLVVQTNSQPGELHFRMCFVSIKKKGSDNWSRDQTNWAEGKYWSNEIKIKIVP